MNEIDDLIILRKILAFYQKDLVEIARDFVHKEMLEGKDLIPYTLLMKIENIFLEYLITKRIRSIENE
jgi:hypothetical protein